MAQGEGSSVLIRSHPPFRKWNGDDFLMGENNERKPRADAERNRDRLLTTAKAVFARKGGSASLEEIAREAGVGIGTLYRHFPTRDALIAAVYRNETAQLAAAAKTLAAKHPPIEALRAWMLLFVDYMTTKEGMLSALDSLVGGTTQLYADTTAQMRTAINMLAERAVASGEAKIDIEPLDLLRAVSSVDKSRASEDWAATAKQLVNILIAGLRTARRSPRS
jgi:AcrR family transcriptional regulator